MIDPTAWFVRKLTYPLWLLRDGEFGIYKYLRDFQRLDHLSPDQLRESQAGGLKKILSHAYENTDYYREIFDSCGFRLDSSSIHDELLKIPPTGKEEIRRRTPAMLARTFAKSELNHDSTGGSTGTPMTFFRDHDCLLKRRAQEKFFDRWLGYYFGDKMALSVAASHSPSGVSGWKGHLRNATGSRMMAFNPYNITDEYMEEFLRDFRKFAPKVIKCFPNSLFVFADFLKRRGYDDLRVHSISCAGETLYDYQRSLMEEMFHCKIFEKYGTREVGVISCECSEHDGMHIFTEGL